jgi:hypothetical protein
MILLITLYLDIDLPRRQEFIECIARNAANPFIHQLHIFVEMHASMMAGLQASFPQLASPKVKLVPFGRRATYQDLFHYANTSLASQRVIVANTDIYFDESLARLQDYGLTGTLVALSRWDITPQGEARLFDYPMSQDAWIFDTPIRDFPCQFYLGVPACDNRLAWEASRAGLALFNPSRSIRANHLHLTGVRRYSERQRLSGATAAVPSESLRIPWLSFVVSGIARLEDLRESIASFVGQERATYILVDRVCPDSAAAWAREHYPYIRVVECEACSCFHDAEARNRGAASADEHDLLCFLETGVRLSDGLSLQVLSGYKPGSFLVPDQGCKVTSSALVCSKSDFERAGGFDQALGVWEDEVFDLRCSLGRMGLVERTFDSSLLRHCPRSSQVSEPPSVASCGLTAAMNAAYLRAKNALLDQASDSADCLAEFDAHLKNCKDVGREGPHAAVAFRERMGYLIGRLEEGVSSHVNDARPFHAIPQILRGLDYTQVVACVVSEIEVEFLASGKLFVLVGTDWEGSRVATAWLRRAARRELIPPLQTRRRTGFEVWSLTAEAGDRVVLPTQVMLVASHLEKR